MLRPAAFGLAALALLAPANASRADATLCNGLQTIALWLAPSLEVRPAEVLEDGCRWGPAQTAPGGSRLPGFGFETLELRGEGLDGLLAGQIPARFEATVTGARPVIFTGDPGMDWMVAAQQRRTRARLHLAFEHDAGRELFTLTDASVTFTEDNAVSLSGVVSGVPADPMAAGETRLMAMGVTELAAELHTQGLFESYVLTLLASAMLYGEDPEPKVAEMKARAAGLIALAPESLLPAASKAALREILDDMPNPNGTIALDLAAEPALGPQRFAPVLFSGELPGIADLFPLLAGVTLNISYDAVPLP